MSRIWPYKVRSIASDFIDFMSLGRDAPARAGLLTWLLCQSARKTARARIGGGSFLRQIMRRPIAALGLWLAAACLFLLRFGDLRLASPAGKAPKREIVVSRAMGGIGDLFVMTPGLRALSKRYSTKVKLVIDRKYFDIFRNNPYVEPIDIDGPPVDVARARVWYNLTLCPAAQYEAARRPFVKKGRAQLFARGMGVGRLALYRHGWNVEYVLDDQMIAFRDAFLRDAGFGARPIVGVQPYARDSYKDHRNIALFVEALSVDYDIIIFHHLETNLASGRGIASTAGLSLARSIALASALKAMVCVDFGLPTCGGRFRRARRCDVRSDRRQIIHPSSSQRHGDFG